jgi:hypothetical protein
MRDAEDLFAALAKSAFRRRFRLSAKELRYARDKGFEVVLQHARDFIRERLAPAVIANDGKQTPMRNHPVFVAQHATATCCRGCLAKWHGLAAGRELSAAEQAYVVGVIERWLRAQGAAEDPQGGLFAEVS